MLVTDGRCRKLRRLIPSTLLPDDGGNVGMVETVAAWPCRGEHSCAMGFLFRSASLGLV